MPWINSRYRGRCAECGTEIEEGDRIYYNGAAHCEECGQDAEYEDKKPSGERKIGKLR